MVSVGQRLRGQGQATLTLLAAAKQRMLTVDVCGSTRGVSAARYPRLCRNLPRKRGSGVSRAAGGRRVVSLVVVGGGGDQSVAVAAANIRPLLTRCLAHVRLAADVSPP